MNPRVNPTSPSPLISLPSAVWQALKTMRSAGSRRPKISFIRRNPSCGFPFSSTSESTRPESSGCSLLIKPCVAKCMMRYRLSSPLSTSERLASKPVALRVDLLGASFVMNSASSLENTRRPKPSLPNRLRPNWLSWKLRAERARSVGATEAVDEDSADRALAIKPFGDALFLAAARRGSSASKTGSARTASVFDAAWRPAASRRMKASAEADGRLTISWFTINGGAGIERGGGGERERRRGGEAGRRRDGEKFSLPL